MNKHICIGILLAFDISIADDLSSISDEFDDPTTLTNWLRCHQTEGWEDQATRSSDPWETWQIDETNGVMEVMPYTSVFFDDFMGGFAYKNVTGDVVITARLRVTARDGTPVPGSDYSLSGILFREEQTALPATNWTRGGHNFLFLSLGHGTATNGLGEPVQQWEIKNTVNSTSVLSLSIAPTNIAIIQVARIGNKFTLLRQAPGGAWTIHGRFDRTTTPFPSVAQVGITAYTDWAKIVNYLDNNSFTVDGATGIAGEWIQNTHYLDATLDPSLEANAEPYNPDIIAYYDYIRYTRPSTAAVAAITASTNFTSGNPLVGGISDATLIGYFSTNANVPGNPKLNALNVSNDIVQGTFSAVGSGAVYRLEYSTNLANDSWNSAGTATATVSTITISDTNSTDTLRVYRGVLEQ